MVSTEKQAPANRKLIVIAMFSIVLALVGVGFLISLILTSNTQLAETDNETKPSSSQPSASLDNSVPAVEGLTVEVNPEKPSTVKVDFIIQEPEDGLVFEYELLDVNRKSVLKGSDNEKITVNEEVNLVSGANSYTLRVRVTDGLTYSDWVVEEAIIVTSTVDVPGVGTEAEPNPEYFNTNWANGVGGDANFEQAMTVAWNAVPFNRELDACLVLNEASLNPGEMIPPVPGGVPEDTVLKYYYATSGDGPYFVTFLWCNTY